MNLDYKVSRRSEVDHIINLLKNHLYDYIDDKEDEDSIQVSISTEYD